MSCRSHMRPRLCAAAEPPGLCVARAHTHTHTAHGTHTQGHGFARLQNRLDFASRTDVFLAEHLGGRSQPPLSVDGSSAEVMLAV